MQQLENVVPRDDLLGAKQGVATGRAARYVPIFSEAAGTQAAGQRGRNGGHGGRKGSHEYREPDGAWRIYRH